MIVYDLLQFCRAENGRTPVKQINHDAVTADPQRSRAEERTEVELHGSADG